LIEVIGVIEKIFGNFQFLVLYSPARRLGWIDRLGILSGISDENKVVKIEHDRASLMEGGASRAINSGCCELQRWSATVLA
jgi:hypothetical protein